MGKCGSGEPGGKDEGGAMNDEGEEERRGDGECKM